MFTVTLQHLKHPKVCDVSAPAAPLLLQSMSVPSSMFCFIRYIFNMSISLHRDHRCVSPWLVNENLTKSEVTVTLSANRWKNKRKSELWILTFTALTLLEQKWHNKGGRGVLIYRQSYSSKMLNILAWHWSRMDFFFDTFTTVKSAACAKITMSWHWKWAVIL